MLKLQKLVMISMLLGGLTSALPVFAMQILNDEMLSDTTGQDGITLTLENTGTSAQVIWTDNDGLASVTGTKGALVFGEGTAANNFRISGGKTVILIDSDAGGSSPFLNIAINLPANLVINTGNIYVAGKDNTGLINQKKIINDTQIELSGLNINAQLGNAPQGNLLQFSGVINNGLRLNNFALIDGSTSTPTADYGIGSSQIIVRDNLGTNLTLDNIGISVTSSGLLVDTSRTTNKIDLLISDLKFGNLALTSPAIGGVSVLGLNLSGLSMTISGH